MSNDEATSRTYRMTTLQEMSDWPTEMTTDLAIWLDRLREPGEEPERMVKVDVV